MDLLVRLTLAMSVAMLAAAGSLLMRRYFLSKELPNRFDRRDVDIHQKGAMLVEFTSPYCIECQVALPILQEAARTHGAPLAVIDARQRPDLAQKYAIRSTPTILVVDRQGTVMTGWKRSPSEQDLSRALASAAS